MARRGIASVARLCARAAAESEGLLARQVSRPALISLLGSAEPAAAGTARVPARIFTSTPTFALSEAEYACVFYPEPEAEVGEQAPGFSLSGERGRVVGGSRGRAGGIGGWRQCRRLPLAAARRSAVGLRMH